MDKLYFKRFNMARGDGEEKSAHGTRICLALSTIPCPIYSNHPVTSVTPAATNLTLWKTTPPSPR